MGQETKNWWELMRNDSRKLIIGFVAALVICGCFFVLGFMEGKHQGESRSIVGTDLSSEKNTTTAPLRDGDADSSQTSAAPQSVWPENVLTENRPAAPPSPQAITPLQTNPEPKPEPKPAPKEPAGKPAAKDAGKKPSSETPAASVKKIYTVQVGAFSALREAESRVKELKNKGFKARIEENSPAKTRYLVKVGSFKDRNEALSMESRLKKSGFDCFIKEN